MDLHCQTHLEYNKEKVLLFALGRLHFLLQPLDLFLQLTLLILTVLLHVLFIAAVPLLQEERNLSDLKHIRLSVTNGHHSV